MDCAETKVFLIINNHCDMRNTYLCLGWCFKGVLRVFHKYFEGASRSFHECFQKDSNLSAFWDVFIKKGTLLCIEVMASTHENSSGQKHHKSTLDTPFTYTRITSKHSWSTTRIHLIPSGNTHEMTLKHPRNTCEIPLKHTWNTNLNIGMYFPCQNDR